MLWWDCYVHLQACADMLHKEKKKKEYDPFESSDMT